MLSYTAKRQLFTSSDSLRSYLVTISLKSVGGIVALGLKSISLKIRRKVFTVFFSYKTAFPCFQNNLKYLISIKTYPPKSGPVLKDGSKFLGLF